jgi:hypothetical protein
MENIITYKGKDNKLKASSKFSFWEDAIIQNYYLDYFDSLSTKQLDREFTNDLKLLTKSLSKLSDSDRKAFINILSDFIEFYLEHKIEKEIDISFQKILKF